MWSGHPITRGWDSQRNLDLLENRVKAWSGGGNGTGSQHADREAQILSHMGPGLAHYKLGLGPLPEAKGPCPWE